MNAPLLREALRIVPVLFLGLLLAGCGPKAPAPDAEAGGEGELDAAREPRVVEEVPKPDFTVAAANPKYQQLVKEAQALLGARPQPLEGQEGPVAGGFSFDVPQARVEAVLRRAHTDFLAKGAYLCRYDQSFGIGGAPDKMALLPTTNKYEVMAALETNGANMEIYTADVIAWMKKLEAEQPFILTGIGFDYMEGYFTTPVKDPRGLANRMYKFCPDIVEQGVGTVEALAKELQKQKLYFWWD